MESSEPIFYQPEKVASKNEKIIRQIQKRVFGVYNTGIQENTFKQKEYNKFKLKVIKEVCKIYKANYKWIKKIINAE